MTAREQYIMLRCVDCGFIYHDYTSEKFKGFERVKMSKRVSNHEHENFEVVTKASQQVEILERLFVQVQKLEDKKH